MVDYPIVSPYREPLLAIEFLIAFIFIEIAGYFLIRYRNNKKNEIPSVVELDWAIIFGCFGIAIICYIAGDFFAVDLGLDRNIFIIIGYLSIVTGGVLFVFHLELSRTIYTGYKLTLFAFSFFFIFFGIYLFFPTILQSVGALSSFFAFGIILIYFLVVIKRIWTFYKLHSMGLFLGVFLWLLGFAGTADIAISLFGGFYIRLIGDIAMIGGLLLVAFFVNTIPSLDTIGWRERIKYVLLTTNTGVGIYSENFQDQTSINQILIAGTIWGIDMFLKNILKDATLKIIQRGNDVILVEKGEYVTGILVVERDLKLFRYLLRKLVLQFEFFFSRVLFRWSGDTSLFNPTKHFIRNIFDYEKK